MDEETLEKYRKIYEIKKAKRLLKRHGCFGPEVEVDLRKKEREYSRLKGGKK